MKKSILFLLFSAFAFGQNTEVLKKLQDGDASTPDYFAKQMIPDFKLVNTYNIDTRSGKEYNFEYLPNTTSDENQKAFLSGTYDYSAINNVKTIFVQNWSGYRLRTMLGKCTDIVPLWTKQINPKSEIEKSGSYEYEDAGNKIHLELNFDALSNQCSIENLN